MTYEKAIQQAQNSLEQGGGLLREEVMAEMDALIEEKLREHAVRSGRRLAPVRHKKPER